MDLAPLSKSGIDAAALGSGIFLPRSGSGSFSPAPNTAATATAFLETNLREQVVGTLQKTLKSHPDKPLSSFIETLREGNPNRETKTIALPKIGEMVTDAVLTAIKHKRRRDRLSQHPSLPLHIEINPTVDNMLTTISEAKTKYESHLQKDIQAVTSGDASHGADTSSLVSSALSRRAQATDVTDFGKAAAEHLPSTIDQLKVFLITPLGRELVFVDGTGYLGDVAIKRSARKTDFSFVRSAELSGSKNKEDKDGDKWSDSDSDADSELIEEQEEPPEDLEQEICDCVTTNGLGRKVFPAEALEKQIAQLFSKTASSLHIPVTRLVSATDKISISPHILDMIDSALGIDDSSPCVPVCVFAFGFEHDIILRNLVTGIATTLGHHMEVKQTQINQLIQIVQDEKKRIRLENQASGNQFTMNPSGYWMKVRERREARDRRREAILQEKKKKMPVPPLPSNLNEHDRAVAEAERQRAQEEREAYLKNLDRRLHEAALRRQARRAREDVDAAESITKSFASTAVLVQSIIRGFLTRRKIREQRPRRQSFRQQYDEASPSSRISLVERYAAHSYEGKNRNRIESNVPWAIERDVLMSLTQDFPEAMTSLVPRRTAKPRIYRTWLPERKRVPPAHEDDVSSEDESWICTTREVHPRLQAARYRMVNPYHKTQQQLLACNCELDDLIQTTELHFSKVSPLQRRAFAALQSKCMHMLHTAFLELNARDQLPPLPRNLNITLASKSFNIIPNNKNRWTFSGFVRHHRPELDSWFNLPHFISQRLHEVAMKHSSILANNASQYDLKSSSLNNNNNPHQIPILSTSYVAFEDLNAGSHWASMAETSGGKGKLMSGAAVANYMRGEGAVQLGPTRVFLVSDTMKTSQIQACLLALNESYKCKKLKWYSTSPFPHAYVYDRAVFAVQYSEHLAKNSDIYRNVSEVMLEGKLNPEAAAARERAAAERRLAEKQAHEKSKEAERLAASNVGNPLSPANKANAADRPRPGLRSGFVGRTVGRASRAASQLTNAAAGARSGATSAIPPGENGTTPEPPTARGTTANPNEISNNEEGNNNTNNNHHLSVNPSSGNLLTANPSINPTPKAATVFEPNTSVIVKTPNIVEKQSVKKKTFPPLTAGGSNNGSSSSGAKDSFISNQSNQSESTTAAVNKRVSVLSSSSDNNTHNNNSKDVDAPHLISQSNTLLGNESTSLLLRSDLTWFGTSWIDLDSRFTSELVAKVKEDQGALTVTIPARGFEDPTPKTIEDFSPSSKSMNPDPDASMSAIVRTASHMSSQSNANHSSSPRSQGKEKKQPSGLTLLMGRFPTRTSPLVADIRNFKTLEAKTVRVVVTIPLKKIPSNHSLGSGNALRGPSVDLGASHRGLMNSQSSTLRPGVSNVAAVKLGGGGTDSRAPRTQSRMVRSMSRVTAAVPLGGGTSAMSNKKLSVAVESDEDVATSETPPPDPASLIQTPQATFSKLFAGHAFDDATFVRFPFLSIGGEPWVQSVSQLIRETYLHIAKGGSDEVCTVVSVSTSDDIFYALVVALVQEVLFTEETLGSKARKAAAQQNAAIAAHNLPGGGGQQGTSSSSSGGGGVRFDTTNTTGGGAGNSSPNKNQDHISKLSTGLSKVASRRFQPVAQAPPPDVEDYTAPTPTPEEVDAFSCISSWVEKHEQDSVELSFAAFELDCMIHKCGLWTTFKMPVIDSKRRAEMARGSLDIRQHIRDACCGLERYLWLLVITRCLTDYRASNPRRFDDDSSFSRASLSIQKGQETPQLMEFVEWRLGRQFFEFLRDGIDPWHKTPKLSPDLGHQKMYSMWPQRWYRNMFTASII